MNLENAKADLANLIAYHEKRLHALANLQWYYGYFGKHPVSLEGPDHDPAENNYCGTSACAGGIMALAPGSGYEIQWLPWAKAKELVFTWPGSPTMRNGEAVAVKWGLSVWAEDYKEKQFYWRLRDILLRMDQRGNGEVPIESVIIELTQLVKKMEEHQNAKAT